MLAVLKLEYLDDSVERAREDQFRVVGDVQSTVGPLAHEAPFSKKYNIFGTPVFPPSWSPTRLFFCRSSQRA